MKKDIRDRATENGYYFPIIFGIIILLLLSASSFGQSKIEVYNRCLILGIEHPEIVTKQAILETGNFECENCSLDYTNFFGFRWKGKYLEFYSWHDCMDYYLKWQLNWFKGKKQYYDFLDCIYVHRDGRRRDRIRRE